MNYCAVFFAALVGDWKKTTWLKGTAIFAEWANAILRATPGRITPIIFTDLNSSINVPLLLQNSLVGNFSGVKPANFNAIALSAALFELLIV